MTPKPQHDRVTLSIRIPGTTHDWLVQQAAKMTIEESKRVTITKVVELALENMKVIKKK